MGGSGSSGKSGGNGSGRQNDRQKSDQNGFISDFV